MSVHKIISAQSVQPFGRPYATYIGISCFVIKTTIIVLMIIMILIIIIIIMIIIMKVMVMVTIIVMIRIIKIQNCVSAQI